MEAVRPKENGTFAMRLRFPVRYGNPPAIEGSCSRLISHHPNVSEGQRQRIGWADALIRRIRLIRPDRRRLFSRYCLGRWKSPPVTRIRRAPDGDSGSNDTGTNGQDEANPHCMPTRRQRVSTRHRQDRRGLSAYNRGGDETTTTPIISPTCAKLSRFTDASYVDGGK